MPLFATFSAVYMPLAVLATNYYIVISTLWVGENIWIKFHWGKVRAVCDSGIRITWVQVSRLPMLHPDNDKWKHTMFTNKSYILACHIDKILQVNVFTV